MHNYEQIQAHCQDMNRIAAEVLDKFLIYYSAAKDKTDKEFEARLKRFSHGLRGMPPQWKGLVKSQYIAHRIFRKNGLIHTYLNQARVQARPPEEYDFLRRMADNPWRFSFAVISANPSPGFFEMIDIFSEDRYLLYSPAMRNILTSQQPLTWFNLISFNGSCWVTFGTVVYFTSFDADDIFFFGTELRPTIDSEATLMADVEDNPVPYMCLFSGGEFPRVQSRGEEVVMVVGTTEVQQIDAQRLEKDFQMEHAKGVTKIAHSRWSEPPDFANAYHSKAEGLLQVTALTDRGFAAFSELLSQYVPNLPTEPDIRIHIPMLTVTKSLLRRDPNLMPYSSLFENQGSDRS